MTGFIKQMIPGRWRRKGKTMQSMLDLSFHRRCRKAIPILVYQMGKVGSYGIYSSLKRVYPGAVLHAHHFHAQHHDHRIRYLYKRTMESGRPLRLITLVREPLGQMMSSFFENFDYHFDHMAYRDQQTPEQLLESFMKMKRLDGGEHWFNTNMKPVLGVDIFKLPFDREKGYQTYENGPIEILLMQCELEDTIKEHLISEFLELPQFQLNRANEGKGKLYAKRYRDFKTHARFSANYLEQLCEGTYFKHFYTKKKRSEVRERWITHSNER